jgi:rubredoxin
VSCTVSAVITESGWQPMLPSVRRSAWMPAPPVGSEAAKARTIGGSAGTVEAGMAARSGSHRTAFSEGIATLGHSSARTLRTRFPKMKKYMCLICGYIYDEETGAPEDGIAPGTRWEDVPPNWSCPECGARKEDFEMIEV